MAAFRDALRDLPDAVFADLLESPDGYRLVLDLPGATAARTEVSVDAGRLSVTVERPESAPADYDAVTVDRPRTLDVTVPLPPDVGGDGASGTVERGVLTLDVPTGDGTLEGPVPIEDG